MTRTLALLIAVVAVGVAIAEPPAVSRPANADETRKTLGLLPDYAAPANLANITVAVLDTGFAGIDGKRPYLPANTTVVEHYPADFVQRNNLGDPAFQRPFTPGDTHGRLMAQLVWATAGNRPEGPKFLLLNANGPTLFRRAVRYAVEQKVDVILFSGTFEAAGNFDGRGPINAAVDEAVAAGILWVNAAGNSGGKVYNGPVDVGADGYVKFRGPKQPTALRFTNRFDENAVTVTLTWNDYRDAEDAGTDKDLDLVVEDAAGKVVGESKLVQVSGAKAAGAGETRNPREKLVLTDLPGVAAGQEYRIRVKAKAGAFGPRDRLRVLVSAAKDAPFTDPATGKTAFPVELLDASVGGEIYPPADHSGVLTVGDTSTSSAVGPTSDGRVKPDVILPAGVARFTGGDETAGSSNAAAYFAGVLAVLRAQDPALNAGHVRLWVRRLDVIAAARAAGNPAANPAALPPPLAVGKAVPPPPLPPGTPIPTNLRALGAGPFAPLSPNSERAMRFADQTLQDPRRPSNAGGVIVSTPAGTFTVQRGGRPAFTYTPPQTPLNPAPQPPVAMNPLPAPQPVARAQAPDEPAAARRPVPPHANWVTPTPRQLADLTR
ncbi:S8 family serine peptidase [bacterium]|nr:S8 family serine peptidase [bacterium]